MIGIYSFISRFHSVRLNIRHLVTELMQKLSRAWEWFIYGIGLHHIYSQAAAQASVIPAILTSYSKHNVIMQPNKVNYVWDGCESAYVVSVLHNPRNHYPQMSMMNHRKTVELEDWFLK